MDGFLVLIVMFLLLLKHLICDFPLQSWPWMYKNKGKILHLGGWTHSGVHVLGTMLVLVPIFSLTPVLMVLLFFEFLAHYLIDFTKVNVCETFNMKPENSTVYWWILGLDQFLHQFCYLLMTFMLCPLTFEIIQTYII